jgi:hypothetical protein
MVQNFKILDLAMAKFEKVNIAFTDAFDTRRNGQPPKGQLTKKSTCQKKSTR